MRIIGVSAMAKGTVKWFNNAKGYGFICPDDGSEEVFVHFSAIDMDGYKTLRPGQAVNYELERGEKGLHASRITVAEEDSPKPQDDNE